MRPNYWKLRIMGVPLLGGLLVTASAASYEASNTLAYDRITAFTESAGIGHLCLSGDGNRIIYATGSKKIFTMNADGSGLSEIFDYADHREGAPFVTPFVDISHDGSKVIWTDTAGEIFAADFDGGNRIALATQFPRPDGNGTVQPEIPTAPVLSPDGQQVYFANSLGRGVILNWSTLAGVYRASTDGSELQLLFSYADLAGSVFGTSGNEYNINIAFGGLDVSDDGSRFMVATGQEGGAIATWDGATFYTMHLKSVSSARQRTLTMSGDGSTVAYVPASSWTVYSNAFTGGNQTELWQLDTFNSAYLQFNEDGSRLAADGWGTGSSPSARLMHGDGSWCLDLMPRLQGYFSEHVTISSSGSRIAWLSAFEDPNGQRQIWVCDVDPPSLESFPVISNPTFEPDYLLLDGSNTTVISADMSGGAGNIVLTNVDPLLGGKLQFRALGFFTNQMLDDGAGSDQSAGDGRFTSADLRRDGLNASEATYTLRIAAFTDDRVTAVDFPGLRMSDGLPEELVDTDGDLLTDLLEVAFGLDPAVPDSAAGWPVVVADPNPPGSVFSITYRRFPDGVVGEDDRYSAGGFVYSVESSADLLGWQVIDDQILSVDTSAAGEVEEATVYLSLDLMEGGNRYLRIRVARE